MNTNIPKDPASVLKPDLLTTSITAGEIEGWMERWNEFKINSAFGTQGQASILAYLKSCISQDILVSINAKHLEMEKEFLEKLRGYIDTRLHPKLIRQLEKMRIHQKQGVSLLDVLSQQVTNYYKAGMDKNSPEERLILLLVAVIEEKPSLMEIFKRTDEINSYSNIIRIAQSIESSMKNSERLLGRNGTVKRSVEGGMGQTFHRCQQEGHRRRECKVPESQIWCQNYHSRRHNTNIRCKAYMEKKEGKGSNKEKEPKKTTGGGRGRGKGRGRG